MPFRLLSHARLAKEDRPAVVQQDRQAQRAQHRHQEQQSGGRTRQVKKPVKALPAAGRPSLLASIRSLDDVFVHPAFLALQESPRMLKSDVAIESVGRIVAIRVGCQIDALGIHRAGPRQECVHQRFAQAVAACFGRHGYRGKFT